MKRGCEFCKGGVEAPDMLVTEGKGVKSYVYVFEGQTITEIHNANNGESYYTYTDINYCPMCGTQLHTQLPRSFKE